MSMNRYFAGWIVFIVLLIAFVLWLTVVFIVYVGC